MDFTPETIEAIKTFVLKTDDISKEIYRIVKPCMSNPGLADLKFLQSLLRYYDGTPNQDTSDFIDIVISAWGVLDATLDRNKNTTESIRALWPGYRLNFYDFEKRNITNREWGKRWIEAGNACKWSGASKTKFIALRNSPIWKCLGNGAGGYCDTYGLSHPPFVVGSNADWMDATEAECKRAGLAIPKVPRRLTRGELDILAAVRKYGMPQF